MNTQILLVPGFWLGARAWDQVVSALNEATASGSSQVEVTALTLPGRHPGDADTESAARTTPQDQAEAILTAMDRRADRRVLVVHSGAAVPGTLVIDQHPELVDHVVWVDTAPSTDGGAMNGDFTADWLSVEDMWEEEMEQGSMRDLTEDQLRQFREQAVPEPGAVVRTPVNLGDDRRLSVPGTVVCTSFPAEQFHDYAQQGVPFLAALNDHQRLDYVDLPTGHWPMWSRPQELAEIILRAAV